MGVVHRRLSSSSAGPLPARVSTLSAVVDPDLGNVWRSEGDLGAGSAPTAPSLLHLVFKDDDAGSGSVLVTGRVPATMIIEE